MLKYTVLLFFLLVSIFLAGISNIYADDGKDIFINKCGSCHKSRGEAAAFAPTKYASTQWDRFFQRDKHKRKKDISADYTESEITAVRAYLINHAADSDQPEAVGLR